MTNPLQNLHPKIRFWLSAIFIMACLAALAWFAFFFLLGRIRAESAEIEAAKIRRASLEARRGEAKREDALLAELQTDIARVESVFVERPLDFFEFLEALASRENLTISLSLGDGAGAEKPEYLRVTISGRYRNLLRFVRGIEASPYETDIQDAAIQMTEQRPVFSDSLARFVIDLRIISITNTK